MYAKVQFAGERLRELLRERLKAQDLCVDPDPDDANPTEYVDHIDVGALNSLQNGPPRTGWVWVGQHSVTRPITGPSIQVAQSVTVYVVKTVDLFAAGANPAQTKSLPLNVVFSIDVTDDASSLVLDFFEVTALV
jgi:hypothetical protein